MIFYKNFAFIPYPFKLTAQKTNNLKYFQINLKIEMNKIKLTKEEREYLELILEDYLLIFKKKKKHQEIHKKIPCDYCKNAKKMLKKLKKNES